MINHGLGVFFRHNIHMAFSDSSLWQQCVDRLAQELPEQQFNTWIKPLQGDLSEAWREINDDYATVAMRFSLIDLMIDRATQRLISGDPLHPSEVTEVWTFRRDHGGAWMISAIQQTG